MTKSNREKRKIAREGALKLKGKTGWDTRDFKAADPIQRLRELESKERGESTYAEADVCADCVAAREKTGDETALCEKHLAEAMGF